MRKTLTALAVASALASSAAHPEFVPFGGGLDLVTPPLFMQPGSCRAAQNYECDVNGGYARVVGYERHDGRLKPSDATYAIITAAITGAFAAGNTVTGATSAATGVVITSTSTSVILTKVTGIFVTGENLQVAAVTQAVSSSAAITDGASTPLLHAQYKNLAADVYRADIAAIPGSGNVLGVVRYNGVTYGFRNNAGASAAALYKSSAAGWVAVALGREISFGSANTITEGQTVTGATSGASAVVTRVILQTGSFGGGTGAGRLIFAAVTGAFQSGENLQVLGVTKAVSSSVDTAITLQPNGRFKFIVKNFGGSTGTKRVYGVDGVNRGFEFDGTVFAPIATGMTADAPSLVWEHKNHLFYAFGASVQHAAPGTPYIWSVILGAAEIAAGDTVTGFMTQAGSETTGALAIFTRNRTFILYGTGVSNWNFVPYRDELGAYTHSVQDIGYTVFLDDQGVTNLQAAQTFGNFSHTAMSARIRPWLNTQRTKVTDSCVSRDKSQYRLFFSDGYALFMTFNGRKVVGMMPALLTNPARCVWSSEESDGSETILFGSTNGMVYQMEKGTSFDGANIEHFLHIAFNFSKSPRVNKRYRRCALEVTGSGYSDFTFSHELGYAALTIPQGVDQSVVTSFSSVFWDAFVWDAFIWDGVTLLPAEIDMTGTAVNVSLMIRGSSDFQQASRFSGANVHFTPRRVVRG